MAFAHAASNSASSTCRPTKFAPIRDAIRLRPPERLTDAIPPLASAASHAIEVARSVRDDLAVCGDIQGGGGYPCARARNAQRQALFRGPAGSPSTFAPMSADRCRSVCWRSFFRPSSHSLSPWISASLPLRGNSLRPGRQSGGLIELIARETERVSLLAALRTPGTS